MARDLNASEWALARDAICFELRHLTPLRADPSNEGNFLGPGDSTNYAIADAALSALVGIGVICCLEEGVARGV